MNSLPKQLVLPSAKFPIHGCAHFKDIKFGIVHVITAQSISRALLIQSQSLPKSKLGKCLQHTQLSQNLVIQAEVNFTNPTKYSATIPFVDISIEKNGTTLGHAQVINATIVPGKNTNVVAKAFWQPGVASGNDGIKVGKELLSQYISGYNTTLTFRTNRNTIPHNPGVGEALSKFNVTIQAPHLSPPSDDNGDPEDPEDPNDPDNDPEDEGPHFIKTATMHLLSSTAVFTLLSPFNLH